MSDLVFNAKELHLKWTLARSTYAPVPTPSTLSSPGKSAKHTALPVDVTINIVFGLVMAALGLVTIYQAARFAAIHVRRGSSVDEHSNECDLQIPSVANVDIERHANAGTASAGPIRQEDLSFSNSSLQPEPVAPAH